jgi:hypothetical protein
MLSTSPNWAWDSSYSKSQVLEVSNWKRDWFLWKIERSPQIPWSTFMKRWGPAQRWYLKSVILATWGAEIESIVVWWGQMRPTQAKTSRDPISTNSWVHWCVPLIPSYTGGWDGENHSPRPVHAKKYVRLHLTFKKLGMLACTCHLRKAGSIK